MSGTPEDIEADDPQLEVIRTQVVTLGKRLGEALAIAETARTEAADAQAKADKALKRVRLIERVLTGLTDQLKEST